MSDKFGQYEVIEKIAQGAVGEVYRVKNEAGEEFALKTLRNQIFNSDNEEGRLRFQREMALSLKLDHPKIVKVHDCQFNKNSPYMVMDFMSEGSVQDLLKQRSPLNPEEVLSIAKDMALALTEIDKLGIVHRDVKPGNILVCEDGYKLTDLGLARLSPLQEEDEDDSDLTIPQTALGTPHYISPEQVINAKEVDIRSDIYSLGTTLYHCLTGSCVHRGKSSLHVMMKHVQDPVKLPEEHQEGIPDSLSHVIMKMLEKNVEDRFATPVELSAALDRISASDGHVLEERELSKPKNKLGMLMFSTFLVLLVLAGGAFIKMTCLAPPSDDPYYLKSRATFVKIPELNVESLALRAKSIRKFLKEYPRDLQAVAIRRAAEVAEILAHQQSFELTLLKAGNFSEARSFEVRLKVGEKLFKFASNGQKKTIFPNEKVSFPWLPSMPIVIEVEEFEWVDDIVLRHTLKDTVNLKDLSGRKEYPVKGEFSTYFNAEGFVLECQLMGISSEDWQIFADYVYPGDKW